MIKYNYLFNTEEMKKKFVYSLKGSIFYYYLSRNIGDRIFLKFAFMIVGMKVLIRSQSVKVKLNFLFYKEESKSIYMWSKIYIHHHQESFINVTS